MPPSAAVGMSGLPPQSKMLPSNTVSVTPAMLTTTAKVYTPPHHLAFTAPRQPPISTSDSTMNPADHARLNKPSGSASLTTVSSLHTSTISTVSHMAGPSANSGTSCHVVIVVVLGLENILNYYSLKWR